MEIPNLLNRVRFLIPPPHSGETATMVVLQQTVNLFPLGKHCRFDSYFLHQTSFPLPIP